MVGDFGQKHDTAGQMRGNWPGRLATDRAGAGRRREQEKVLDNDDYRPNVQVPEPRARESAS
jgi:hypothetical protein